MYQQHPSEELNRLFHQKPYQGQNPEFAQLIFFGLDANFSEDIEDDIENFEQIKEYLKDGVAYWEKYSPERLPLVSVPDRFQVPFFSSKIRH